MPEWTDRVRERLTGLRLDPATEAETIEEVTQHLDDRYRDLLANGMTEPEAAAQAWRELDGHPRLSHEISAARALRVSAPIQNSSGRGLVGLWDDFLFAFRRLRHAPGFVLVALVTVTLTVGANTAILSVADAVLFRPLPYADPGNVAIIQMLDKKSGRQSTMTPYAFLEAVNDGCPSVSDVALLEGVSAYPGLAPTVRPTVESPDGAVGVPVMEATSNYFALLGVQPVRGRLFTSADAGAEGRAALMSHAAWQRMFAGDESIPGKTITLGAVSFDVVGILPPGFVFPSVFAGRPSLVVLRKPMGRGEKGGTFHAIARIADGVTHERAQAEIEAATAPVAKSLGRESVAKLNDVRTILYPVGRPIMRFLVAAALFILLLGCANLANMMIVRGRRGLHDTAVRLALGASRARLVRPMLFEALILGVGGALLAVGLTSVTFDTLLRQVPPSAYGRAAVGVDTRVTLMALAMGLICALAFSVVPAWRASGVDVLALIQRRGGRGSRVRLGQPLVAIQVAIAVAVVFGAAIAGQAFVSVLRTPLGFSAERVALIGIAPPTGTTDVQAFYRKVIDTLTTRVDVVAAGAAGSLPFTGAAPFSATKDRKVGIVHAVPGYMEAAAIQVLLGRSITWEDVRSDPAAAMVSQSASRVMFGSDQPLGATFESHDGRIYHVVGVVADVVNSLSRESRPQVYVIPGQDFRGANVIARFRDRRADTLSEIKREIRSATGVTATADWWDEQIQMDTAFRDPRFQTIVLAGLSTLALGLTALGIFGVVAYLVSARMREMGVRLAIGASPESLVRLVVRQALVPVAVGIICGFLLIQWGRSLAEAQLFKVDTSNPVSLAAAAGIVVIAAIAAAYVPARRATKINPTEVLRAE
jgi:putative ABC transport system permease protein